MLGLSDIVERGCIDLLHEINIGGALIQCSYPYKVENLFILWKEKVVYVHCPRMFSPTQGEQRRLLNIHGIVLGVGTV